MTKMPIDDTEHMTDEERYFAVLLDGAPRMDNKALGLVLTCPQVRALLTLVERVEQNNPELLKGIHRPIRNAHDPMVESLTWEGMWPGLIWGGPA